MFILDDKQKFNNTLCYDNVDDYDFLSCKMFRHKDGVG